MRVIGTAGHVDHGKSSLVRRLTGIDPDRLLEEKKREMTIDLGFAWLPMPDGDMLGIVDVPGHRDFIENMLAGVGGIDAALIIVAADEGIMPQTREHLAILDLLGVEEAIVVLTKIDLIDDDEWLQLIEADLKQTLRGTPFQQAPILKVSAKDGSGIADLIRALQDLIQQLPVRADYRQPRLPIDRVFSIDGFGTVVTGTLSGGTLEVGYEVELQPTQRRARIRNLQSYKQDISVALPGSRVAVNLAGIDKQSIQRGQVLSLPGEIRSTTRLDVWFRHLNDVEASLKHNTEVKFFCGASETIARVRLLNDEILAPGSEGWLQIELTDPIALVHHDRYILRIPSPAETIGGGIVVDPHPGRRWRRFRPDLIERLQTRLEGSPSERLSQLLNDQPMGAKAIQRLSALDNELFDQAITTALAEGLIVQLNDGSYWSILALRQWLSRIEQQLRQFHGLHPLKVGMPREELRSSLGIKGSLLNAILFEQAHIESSGPVVRLASHQVHFTDEQQARVDELMNIMAAQAYNPPSYSEAADMLGTAVLHALIDQQRIIHISPDLIFTNEAYQAMVAQIVANIRSAGSIDAKTVRDLFGSSRKYAIGLLEHLDSQLITRRKDDVRVLGSRLPEWLQS